MSTKKLTLLLCIFLSACHSIDTIERPTIEFSEAWQTPTEAQANEALDRHWWQSFQSPQLDSLVNTAVERSPDLRIAAERARQAELQMNISGATLFPALNLTGSSGSTRNRVDSQSAQTSESSRVSLGASYEVDLWGRLSASRFAAEASFNASQFDLEAAHLSLTSGVASAWFEWLTLQERIRTAQQNIEIAQKIYDIVDARYRNGVASAVDLASQRTNLLTLRAALLPLELQARQTLAALAVLTGQVPQNFQVVSTESLMGLHLPDIAAGIPSDIITRRPDLASVEARLLAADADVSAARAALLPSVQLSASLGRAAGGLWSLNNPTDSSGWSLSLAQTLFNGGRLRNQVKLSESQRVVLLEQYRQAIYTALREVDDALDRLNVGVQQEQRQEEIITQAQRALNLASVRYREGSDDLVTLLNAQRNLFQAQDQGVQQRLARLNASIDLYKALGGGWRME